MSNFVAAISKGINFPLYEVNQKTIKKWKYADDLYDILKAISNYKAICKEHRVCMSWDHIK
jgi:hypothetical protein